MRSTHWYEPACYGRRVEGDRFYIVLEGMAIIYLGKTRRLELEPGARLAVLSEWSTLNAD